MRGQLRQRENERTTFRGTFERFGKKSAYRGQDEKTVLLKDITDLEGNSVCDHLWFNFTKGFESLDLQPGDVVQFDARVKQYVKGYRGHRDDIGDRPIQADYKLSHPTRVMKVAPPSVS